MGLFSGRISCYRMDHDPRRIHQKMEAGALTERAAAHTHFLDLCKLFEHEDPVSADPTGEWFAFEKGATKAGGGEGFADVWKKNFFAWEYKKKKRDLNAAMDQLVRYAAALENPPLQVVCDTDRFIVRTAWTNAVPKQYEDRTSTISCCPKKGEILWAVFHDPGRACDSRKPAPASPKRPPTNSPPSRCGCKAGARRRKWRTSSTSSCSVSLPTASSFCRKASFRKC